MSQASKILKTVTALLFAISAILAADPKFVVASSGLEMKVEGIVFSAVDRIKGGYVLAVLDLASAKKERSLQVFDAGGKLIRKILPGTYDGPPFSNVYKLRTDPSTGLIWLADMGQSRVLMFDEDGNFKSSFLIQRPSHGVDDVAFGRDSNTVYTSGCVTKSAYASSGCASRLQQYSLPIKSPSRTMFPNFEDLDALFQRHYQLSLSSIALNSNNQIAFGDTPDRAVSVVDLGTGAAKRFSIADKIPTIPNLAELPGGPFEFTMNNPTLGDIEVQSKFFIVGLRQLNGTTPASGIFSWNASAVRWLQQPPGSLVGHNRLGKLLYAKTTRNGVQIVSVSISE